MSGALIQTIDRNKRIALVKEEQCYRLLRDLAELVKHGDRLAIEGYLRESGFKGFVVWGGAEGFEENGSSRSRFIYSDMVKRDAVNDVLIRAGRAMTSVEIYEELVKGGYPFTGRDPLMVFRSEIYKLAAKAERGKFVPLAEYLERDRLNGDLTCLNGDFDGADSEAALTFFGLDSVRDLEFTSSEFSTESALDGDCVGELVLCLETDNEGVAVEELAALGEANGVNGSDGVGAFEEGRGAADAASLGDFAFLGVSGELVERWEARGEGDENEPSVEIQGPLRRDPDNMRVGEIRRFSTAEPLLRSEEGARGVS